MDQHVRTFSVEPRSNAGRQAITRASSTPNPRTRRFLAPGAVTPSVHFPQPTTASPPERTRKAPLERRLVCRTTARLPQSPPPPSWTKRARAPLLLLPLAHSPATIPLPPSSHRTNAENTAAATAVSRPRAPPLRDLPPPSTSADPQRPGASSRRHEAAPGRRSS